jgi:hypothetical protein
MGGLAAAEGSRLSGAGADMAGPPRTRLAFRVGVVGHRPDRLPKDRETLEDLRTTLHAILHDVREALVAASTGPDAALYSGGAPILRAISPLAEGSDRLFAGEALALGYALCCPMPFFQEEFEKDFVPPAALEKDSLVHFRKLLDQARAGAGLTIFEMDGDRAEAPEAYGAAGRIVLNQTDLLVLVWDGGEPKGRGGTVHSLHEALRFHVPTIWVDARNPERWHLLHTHADLVVAQGNVTGPSPDRQQLREAVCGVVHAELSLPSHTTNEIESHAPDYFAETVPKRNSGIYWKLFRNIVADGKYALPSTSVEDFAAQIRKEWSVAADGGTAPSAVADWINSRLRVPFAWADGLADFYGDAHRSAFIVSYLTAAGAVFLALLPTALFPNFYFEAVCGVIEFLALYKILRLLQVGRTKHWHERWTDYRLLAELIRELRFLVPLGGGKPLPRIPAHLAVYGDPARTWMYWYVRGIAREIGIPAAKVTPSYMRDCIDFLDHVVGDTNSGQQGFHLVAERRAHLLGTRLRNGAWHLFRWTFISVGVRLALGLFHKFGWFYVPRADGFLLLLSAVLPAFGAAFEGISNQGEFIRISKRSAAMASGFAKYAARIALIKKGPAPKLAEIIPMSSAIADAMVAEVVDWRAVFIDRPQ